MSNIPPDSPLDKFSYAVEPHLFKGTVTLFSRGNGITHEVSVYGKKCGMIISAMEWLINKISFGQGFKERLGEAVIDGKQYYLHTKDIQLLRDQRVKNLENALLEVPGKGTSPSQGTVLQGMLEGAKSTSRPEKRTKTSTTNLEIPPSTSKHTSPLCKVNEETINKLKSPGVYIEVDPDFNNMEQDTWITEDFLKNLPPADYYVSYTTPDPDSESFRKWERLTKNSDTVKVVLVCDQIVPGELTQVKNLPTFFVGLGTDKNPVEFEEQNIKTFRNIEKTVKGEVDEEEIEEEEEHVIPDEGVDSEFNEILEGINKDVHANFAADTDKGTAIQGNQPSAAPLGHASPLTEGDIQRLIDNDIIQEGVGIALDPELDILPNAWISENFLKNLPPANYYLSFGSPSNSKDFAEWEKAAGDPRIVLMFGQPMEEDSPAEFQGYPAFSVGLGTHDNPLQYEIENVNTLKKIQNAVKNP